MRRQIRSLALAGIAATAVAHAAIPARSAPINYGDFSDIPPGTVMYLDVTESANSPGDAVPLYGAPAISENTLDFDPAGFHAAADSAPADFTDGQLNITLFSPGDVISEIALIGSGDFSFFGSGSALAARGMSLAVLSVLEIDGNTLDEPIRLPGASSSGSSSSSSAGAGVGLWNLSLYYDVTAALTEAGPFFFDGATRIEIAIDTALGAISDMDSIAAISVKDFAIAVTTTEVRPIGGSAAVPEPGSGFLVGLGLCGLACLRRRRSA